jgi:hypothetical protein
MTFTTRDILGLPDSPAKRAMLEQLHARPPATAEQAKAKLPRRVAGVMNKTEAAFARHLEYLRNVGEVLWFAYEPFSLRLARRTRYTPDFVVVLADGTTVLREVKGRKGETYYCRETSKVKVKLAGELFGWPIAIVWPLKGGGWGSEDFGRPRNPALPRPRARPGVS